jgi:LuxR family maltose regulon positive regulatory protein
VRLAQQALECAPPDDHLNRGAAAAILGLSWWTRGDLDRGFRSYAEGMASLGRAGNIADTIGGGIALADIQIVQGRLHDAMNTFAQRLQRAIEPGIPVLRGAADMHVGMSSLYGEWNDLEAANRHLAESAALGEVAGFPQNPYRWCVAMARIREAEGDRDGALEMLQEADRRYVSDFYPNVRPIAAMRARVWIAQGRFGDALGWAREQGLDASDDLSYLREFEHMTLARLLVARGTHDRSADSIREAATLLDRLAEAAEAGKRTGSLIEILAMRALAQANQGDLQRALLPLERALTLAEPEGYVRLFAGEGEAMRTLLRQAVAAGIATKYAHRLLSIMDAEAQPASIRAGGAMAGLPEPLTAREIEVLRLIAAGLRNEEIAGQLYISLATVKRHIANAYGKLGVTHRTQAVARANELGLL